MGRNIAIVGAVLLIVGAFLPWASMMGEGVSGVSGLEGKLAILMGVIVGVFLFVKVPWAKWAIVVAGIVGLLVGIKGYLDIKEAMSAMEALSALGEAVGEQVDLGFSIGLGVYLVIVGGIVAAVGGFMKKAK
jgi:hypothetical protein